MIIKYDPDFLAKLKKLDVRIRKSFKKRLTIFIKDPHNPQLNNHALKRNYFGYRSVDITSDWGAVYAEKTEEMEAVAYFVDIGTHRELYTHLTLV